jgi:hypothetical protein
MVCNAQNYWGFGLGPSSSILKSRKHSISETGSVFLSSDEKGDTYSVGL